MEGLKGSAIYLQLLRPQQWLKNLLVASPLFFSGRITERLLGPTVAAMVCFSLVASLGYIINDWIDRERDIHHNEKKNRPLASGKIGGRGALFISFSLIILVLLLFRSFSFPPGFTMTLSAYLLLTVGYSLHVKNIPLLEIFSVAMGFVLRVLAGGTITGIEVSGWLFLTVFFIAMMISVAKRLNELELLGPEAAIQHRGVQALYSASYLRHLLWACGSITLVVYALYTMDHHAIIRFSVIPAAYGVFRFLYLVDKKKGSDPIKTLFADRQLLLATLIFLMILTVVIYR